MNTLFFRHLLMCRVTLGKSFVQYNAIKIAHAPPGHHSVMGTPSVGGLNFSEYVVYRGEQVKIMLLISNLYLQYCIFLGISWILNCLPNCEPIWNSGKWLTQVLCSKQVFLSITFLFQLFKNFSMMFSQSLFLSFINNYYYIEGLKFNYEFKKINY